MMDKPERGTEVKVSVIPDCDLCKHFEGKKVPARYDGATRRGSWANMCERHFSDWGVGLGVGRGQRLVLRAQEGESSDVA